MPDTMTDSAMLHKSFDASLEAIEGTRDVIATVTTWSVDRDQESVLPAGIDLTNYKRNPVVLWSHDAKRLPVGKCLWIKPTANGQALVARVHFGTHAEADDVMRCYKDGLLSAFSIGFRPIEGGRPTPAEVKARPELANCKTIYRRVELGEFSAVAIPANPEALVIVKSLKTAAIRGEIEGATMDDEAIETEAPAETVVSTNGGHPDEPTAEPVTKAATEGAGPSGGYTCKAGDYVEWGKGMKAGAGRVKSVHKSGKVPGVAEEIEGSDAEPAAKVKCYKADDAGKWRGTERHVGMACKDLSPVAHPMDDEPEDEDDPADSPTETTAKAAVVPVVKSPVVLASLPTLKVGRTRAEAEKAERARMETAVVRAIEKVYGAV